MNFGNLVAISTRDRPETLRRSLRRHVGYAVRFGHRCELLVVDESPGPDVQARNAGATRELGREDAGICARYFGPVEKRAYAVTLAECAGIPQPVVDFALFGWPELPAGSGGANLNAFLLQTIGAPGLCFDDDIICRVAEAPEREAGWTLSSRLDPTETHFFASREEAFARANWVDEDLYSRLLEPLGRTVTELFDATPPGALDLAQVQPAWARELGAGDRSARVLFSSLGLLGDHGMANPAYFLKLGGATRERLLGAGEAHFFEVLKDRQVARGVRRRTLNEPTWFQSFAFGVDARQLLPPFVPAFRGSDTFMAGILRVCWARPLLCHLPCQICHVPPERRAVDLAHFAGEAGRTSLSHWFHAALSLFLQSAEGCGKTDPATKLMALGRHLQRLSKLSLEESAEVVGGSIRRERERELAQLEALRCEYAGEPEFWARQVCALEASILQTLDEPLFHAPTFIPTLALAPAEAVRKAQRLLGDFGILLQFWPGIWEGAKKLAQISPHAA